jgi:uncharacterized membrane protein
MEWPKLIGVALVAVGFALRWNPLVVILVAGFATGFTAGFGPMEILALMGRFFVENRFMTLPIVLLVPLIGLLERYGLQERAGQLIGKMAGATAGGILFLYQAMRQVTSMFGLAIGGHTSMVRPLISPMAEAAAEKKAGLLPEALRMKIRAHAAAAENWGNFFADDIFVAVGPVLLMGGVFKAAGVEVSLKELGLWGLPTAAAALGLGWWRYRKLNRRIQAAKEERKEPA